MRLHGYGRSPLYNLTLTLAILGGRCRVALFHFCRGLAGYRSQQLARLRGMWMTPD